MKWIMILFQLGAEVQQKGWYASKTVWVNVLTILAALSAWKFGYVPADADLATLSLGLAAAGNIVLRFATKVPVGGKTVPVSATEVQPVYTDSGGRVAANGKAEPVKSVPVQTEPAHSAGTDFLDS